MIMTRDKFDFECSMLSIDPAIALENENVRKALLSQDDSAIIDALENNF
jgi:hypothetical protein